jgi:hypothetical protein
MYATVGHKTRLDLYGRTPFNSIFQDSLYVFVVKRSAGLMSGMEVKYLTEPSCKGSSASENISVLIPSTEYKIIGFGDKEWLGIKLLKKLKMCGNSFCNRVRRTEIPNYCTLISTPSKITCRSYYCLKRL